MSVRLYDGMSLLCYFLVCQKEKMTVFRKIKNFLYQTYQTDDTEKQRALILSAIPKRPAP